MAVARAAAEDARLPLYAYLGGAGAVRLPVPMMNILNGGKHADNSVDFQEFMVMPVGAPTFAEALRYGAETFHALAGILKKQGYSTSVGDEGGFAPNLKSNEEACERIVQAIEAAGFKPGKDVAIALDPAASSFFSGGAYDLAKSGGGKKSSDEMIALYQKWVDAYPIVSIEDGLDENDWAGFARQTAAQGERIQIVGDDIFVTNKDFVRRGVAGENREFRADQTQPDRHGDRNDPDHRTLPRGGLEVRGVAPFGRNRGHVHGGFRGGHGRRSDQDRFRLPQRAHRQIQPPARNRAFARQGCGVRLAVRRLTSGHRAQIGDGRPSGRSSQKFRLSAGIVHVEFDRVRRHLQAEDLLHLQVDIAVDEVLAENVAVRSGRPGPCRDWPSASRKLPQTVGIFFSSCGGRS